LGDEVVFKINGRETSWRIVGVATGGSIVSTVFVNYNYLSRLTNDANRAEWVFTKTEQHDAEYQTEVSKAMQQHFERIGLGVGMTAVVTEERAEVQAIFEVIVVLLLIMAILLAVIGGLGLMGTMSINVLERTREIGVMRAIGASNRSIQRIFIVEGVMIGVLSWLIGGVVAFPVSKFLSDVVGQQFLSTPLDYTFSIGGLVIWLIVVIILSAVASFLPAWNASRVTVREVLAYE
jgi:putative ABC transport system permease protein